MAPRNSILFKTPWSWGNGTVRKALSLLLENINSTPASHVTKREEKEKYNPEAELKGQPAGANQ